MPRPFSISTIGLKRPSSTSWLNAASITFGDLPSVAAAVSAAEIDDLVHRQSGLAGNRVDVGRALQRGVGELILAGC